MNDEVFRLAIKQIVAEPENWDQKVWARRTACGTAFCLAGTVVDQAGAVIDWESDPDDGDQALYCTLDGQPQAIWATALELLDITEDEEESWGLFDETNTVEDMQEIWRRMQAAAG